MDQEELEEIAGRLQLHLQEECGKNGTQMIFFMLTDILSEDTLLLSYGKGSADLVTESFGVEVTDGKSMLKKVVSRKKQ